MPSDPIPSTVGIVAGGGTMPAEALHALRARGRRVVLAAIRESGAVDPGADAFAELSVGRIGELVSFFKDNGVRDLLVLGKLDKGLHFAGIEFDELALRGLALMQDRTDMSLFGAVVAVLEEQGLRLLPQDAALYDLLCPVGTMGKVSVGTYAKDVQRALSLAREIARLDIGQSVAVREGLCLAVEAAEHTDEMIKRAGALPGGGTVIAKVPRPGQDPRFDVPTVGPQTIRTMAKIEAAGLALAAGAVFVIDSEQTIRLADEAGIFIVGQRLPGGS
ncbi:MAG: UDP-2,3-diacylglucosamine diphosphatase LpxI [Candidatus Alcyoniella australis]|nr:UDP-2,3-diacylglucosamine diphosphatase LpxI [Candidatus Alcyoniella australis]